MIGVTKGSGGLFTGNWAGSEIPSELAGAPSELAAPYVLIWRIPAKFTKGQSAAAPRGWGGGKTTGHAHKGGWRLGAKLGCIHPAGLMFSDRIQ